ncbi:MAG: HD domain-containing protein, partial [Anaerotignum sp.]|nr:HD domain-containing protein [Anaerotignum sp.]
AMETQAERERMAAERIFGLLPDDQREDLRGLFEEFEAGETAEAKFARTMDNLQPLMLNDSNNGGDWREHQVTKTQIMKRHARNQIGSEVIGAYTKELIEKNVRKGNIRDE